MKIPRNEAALAVVVAFALSGAGGSTAFGQGTGAVGPSNHTLDAEPSRVIAELRGGVQSVIGVQSPIVCGEVSPHAVVSFEACGGQIPAMARGNPFEFTHFRLEGNIPLLERSLKGTRVLALAQPGVGFGEIENGADEPGFLFGPARSLSQREAAGPEASLSGKVRVKGTGRLVFSAELNTTVSWIAAAPVVVGSDGPLLVSAVATVGVGF